MMEHFRGMRGNTAIVRRMMDTADRNGVYADAETYGAGHLDLKAALAPVGTLTAGQHRCNAQASRLETPRAFGPIGQRLERVEIATFDAHEFPFRAPIQDLVRTRAPVRSPIPAMDTGQRPVSAGLDALGLRWTTIRPGTPASPRRRQRSRRARAKRCGARDQVLGRGVQMDHGQIIEAVAQIVERLELAGAAGTPDTQHVITELGVGDHADPEVRRRRDRLRLAQRLGVGPRLAMNGLVAPMVDGLRMNVESDRAGTVETAVAGFIERAKARERDGAKLRRVGVFPGGRALVEIVGVGTRREGRQRNDTGERAGKDETDHDGTLRKERKGDTTLAGQHPGENLPTPHGTHHEARDGGPGEERDGNTRAHTTDEERQRQQGNAMRSNQDGTPKRERHPGAALVRLNVQHLLDLVCTLDARRTLSAARTHRRLRTARRGGLAWRDLAGAQRATSPLTPRSRFSRNEVIELVAE